MARKKENSDKVLLIEDGFHFVNFKVYVLKNESTEEAYTIFGEDVSINIGVLGDFSSFYESFIHELEESFMMLNNCRYADTRDPNFEMSECIFLLTHTQFQKMNYYTSSKVVRYFPLLFKTWLQYNSGNYDENVLDPYIDFVNDIMEMVNKNKKK